MTATASLCATVRRAMATVGGGETLETELFERVPGPEHHDEAVMSDDLVADLGFRRRRRPDVEST